MRFVEDLTQTEIAERVGISQMQVSRLLRRSLDQLRALTTRRADTRAEDVAAAASPIGADWRTQRQAARSIVAR